MPDQSRRQDAPLRALVARFATFSSDQLTDATLLGTGGLGLDSIAIAEFLLEVQDEFGVDAASLLDGSDLTFGMVAEKVRAGKQA
jgi:hypothetical protein